MSPTSKSAVTTLAAGLALLVPAAIGFDGNGPTIIHPLPALTTLPAFLLAEFHIWKAALAIPMLLFFVWNPGLLFGDGKIPKRTSVLLAVLTVLSVAWFVGGWKFGMEYQGAKYTYTVCILNVVSICFLGLVFVGNRRKEYRSASIFYCIGFCLLGWLGTPFPSSVKCHSFKLG